MGQIQVQIYTMQSVAEALAVAALGVSHVGVTPADHGLPGEIDQGLAADICNEVRDLATTVALSVDTDLDAIVGMVRTVKPDVLHLCGPPSAVGPADVLALRDALPGVAFMQAIAVTGKEAVKTARSYEPLVDFLILDSVSPDVVGIGAAGTTHDWELSAAIVKAVDIPVFLAGGLSPDNVAAAISAVRPWGVDSLTHTNRPDDSGGFTKDLAEIERFVVAARGQR